MYPSASVGPNCLQQMLNSQPVAPAAAKKLLPAFDELDDYWRDYFTKVDDVVAENFWGNLSILQKSKEYGDPYVAQLEQMGVSLQEGRERPLSFYQAISWVMEQIEQRIENKEVSRDEVILPAKAFRTLDNFGTETIHFIPIGKPIPKQAEPLNLLVPSVFVRMLAEGYFPIGEPIREHTNQSLAEHDLAHMGGFISNPRYMKAVRQAFATVQQKMEHNPQLAEALNHFDSLYSLRLYYMIEIFSEITQKNRRELACLIELSLDMPISSASREIKKFLHDKAKDPKVLAEYLAKLYRKFHELVNPLGGESRDLLNRRRKFHRGATLGSFYDGVSKFSSKFDGNSIYSLFLNAKAALENIRSNHKEYQRAIDEIHAPLIGALIGTSQLAVEDWVLQAVEETPNPESKLYKYLYSSDLWPKDNILRLAHTHPNYSHVLTSDEDISRMAGEL